MFCVQLGSIRAAIDLVKEQGNYIQSDEACTALMRGYSEWSLPHMVSAYTCDPYKKSFLSPFHSSTLFLPLSFPPSFSEYTGNVRGALELQKELRLAGRKPTFNFKKTLSLLLATGEDTFQTEQLVKS